MYHTDMLYTFYSRIIYYIPLYMMFIYLYLYSYIYTHTFIYIPICMIDVYDRYMIYNDIIDNRYMYDI